MLHLARLLNDKQICLAKKQICLENKQICLLFKQIFLTSNPSKQICLRSKQIYLDGKTSGDIDILIFRTENWYTPNTRALGKVHVNCVFSRPTYVCFS